MTNKNDGYKDKRDSWKTYISYSDWLAAGYALGWSDEMIDRKKEHDRERGVTAPVEKGKADG